MEKELRIEFTRNPYIITIRYDGEMIWEHYYEHPVDFISALHKIESMNDKELYDWCTGTATYKDINLKKELKNYLREMGIQQEDLYHLTGYHFIDIETAEDLKECKRLLFQVCFGRNPREGEI